MTRDNKNIESIKADWQHLMNLAATGQILDVYGFSPDDDPEAIFENQCYKPICAYMEQTGLTFEDANKELLDFYSLNDAYGVIRHQEG